MFAVQNVIRKAPRLASLAVAQQRTIVSGPPRVRVSLAEKTVLGFVFYFGVLAIPMYISTQIKHYRGTQTE